jgi:hypothetical protein
MVIFQEDVSFDHYLATYPNAANNNPTEPFFGHASSDAPPRIRPAIRTTTINLNSRLLTAAFWINSPTAFQKSVRRRQNVGRQLLESEAVSGRNFYWIRQPAKSLTKKNDFLSYGGRSKAVTHHSALSFIAAGQPDIPDPLVAHALAHEASVQPPFLAVLSITSIVCPWDRW